MVLENSISLSGDLTVFVMLLLFSVSNCPSSHADAVALKLLNQPSNQ